MNNNLGPAAGAHIHYQVPVAAVHPAGRVGSEAWVLGFAYWILLPAAKSLLYRKATNLTPALPVLHLAWGTHGAFASIAQRGDKRPRSRSLFLRESGFGICLGQCMRTQISNQLLSEAWSQGFIASQSCQQWSLSTSDTQSSVLGKGGVWGSLGDGCGKFLPQHCLIWYLLTTLEINVIFLCLKTLRSQCLGSLTTF